MSDMPLSSFKQLIVSTPILLCGLHTMSLAMAAPKGLKDPECKKTTLLECPSILYVREKYYVQETVSSLKLIVSRPRLAKMQNVEFPSGNLGCTKLFSFPWDLL
jgi:hypothetical protein